MDFLADSQQSQELFDPVGSQERAEPPPPLTSTNTGNVSSAGWKNYADAGRYFEGTEGSQRGGEEIDWTRTAEKCVQEHFNWRIPNWAPRIRKKKTEETEIEELSIHHQVESDDDSIYLTAEYPVQNEDTSEDGSIPTLTGDDQESAECLEEGSREDAPNQNTEASDDPDTSSSSSNSSISGVIDDTQDEIHEDDDTDDDDQNIPRRSTRVRQKPKWMENFVCSQLAYQPSKWKEKVLCFKEMASELKEMDKEMSKEFLKCLSRNFDCIVSDLYMWFYFFFADSELVSLL